MIVFFLISRTSQHHTQDYLGLLLLSGMHHLHNYGGSTIQPLNLSTIIIGKDLVLQGRSGFRENLLQFSQEIYISPKKNLFKNDLEPKKHNSRLEFFDCMQRFQVFICFFFTCRYCCCKSYLKR